jgi:hypothetical protein
VLLLAVPAANAIDIDWGDVTGTLKTRISSAAAWRIQDRDVHLIAEHNLNPNVCINPSTGQDDDCFSFTGDTSRVAVLNSAAGAHFGHLRDDGDLNYNKWDVISAVTKVNPELSLSWKDYTFKFAVLGFYDPINEDFNESHVDTAFQPASTKRDNQKARSIGLDWVLKDALVATTFKAFDHDFSINVGYQHIRWGESTLVALNSLSEINPPDARLLYQPGTAISEIFNPTPAILLNTTLMDGMSLDLMYQLAWNRVNLPSGGSFLAPIDGYNRNSAEFSLGQFHEDPNGIARLPNPGNVISDTSVTVQVLDKDYGRPSDFGQFGGKLTWYAADLNGGTEFGFYFLNYHSRLPIISAISANQSCMRNSPSFIAAFGDCNGFIGLNSVSGKEPLPIDTAKVFFDYPENIHMVGMSFNTNFGKWSLAGEVSYRPNVPVQVDVTDIFMAAAQPAFPRQDLVIGANEQTLLQNLQAGDPTQIPGALLGIVQSLNNPTGLANLVTFTANAIANNETVTIPSSRHLAPDYLEAYRHHEIQPNEIIRGYERLKVMQFDLTGIRALGSTDNPIGADQIIFIAEAGATWAMNMPNRSELQFEGGDLNDTHYSAGADGTGSDHADSLRFNPTQQTSGFADPLSYGYRFIIKGEYDNVFLGWNIKPQIIWLHDLHGIGIYPMQNFIQGQRTAQTTIDFETGTPWLLQLYYQVTTGGGTVSYWQDKDNVGLGISYTF